MHRLPDPAPKLSYFYRVFGLAIESELALPDLEPIDPVAPDVRVRLGSPSEIADEKPGAFLLEVGEAATFRIDGGREIVVVPAAGADERNIRLFLLGSAIGILLHQRGLLALHAAAVEIDGRAIALMGHSGAGKSTLAAWFHDHRYPVISDDIAAIRLDRDGAPLVTAGLRRMRLWDDAMAASGRDSAAFDRSFVGDEDYAKFDVPFDGGAQGRERPLAAIYLLGWGEAPGFAAISGVAALEALYANTYRGGYVGVVGGSDRHWDGCRMLLDRVPLFRFLRARDGEKLGESADALAAHVRSLG